MAADGAEVLLRAWQPLQGRFSKEAG